MENINNILILSNLYGIYPIYHSLKKYRLWIIFIVLISILTNIAEIKYNYNILYPINLHSNDFFWLSRIIIFALIIYILFDIDLVINVFSNNIFIFGLICLTISETFNSQNIFILFRSLWNISIYHVIYLHSTRNL